MTHYIRAKISRDWKNELVEDAEMLIDGPRLFPSKSDGSQRIEFKVSTDYIRLNETKFYRIVSTLG